MQLNFSSILCNKNLIIIKQRGTEKIKYIYFYFIQRLYCTLTMLSNPVCEESLCKRVCDGKVTKGNQNWTKYFHNKIKTKLKIEVKTNLEIKIKVKSRIEVKTNSKIKIKNESKK